MDMHYTMAKDCANRRTETLKYLFLLFIAGSAVGWAYEEIFYWITEGMLRNRGVLYGPWLPIYGAGAVGMYALKPFRKNPVLLYIMCAAVAGVVEYAVGLACVRLWGMWLWDYRGLFCNLNGIICLRSVAAFGAMGLAFHYLLEPAAERMSARMDDHTRTLLCRILLAVFLLDCVLSGLFRTPITY